MLCAEPRGFAGSQAEVQPRGISEVLTKMHHNKRSEARSPSQAVTLPKAIWTDDTTALKRLSVECKSEYSNDGGN